MNTLRFTLLVLSTVLSLNASAAMFKWVDKDGRVHFGDQPPPDAQTQSVGGTVNGYSSDGAVTDDCGGGSGSGAKVTMYSAEWCGVCKKASAYMQQNGIAFTERDIDKSKRARSQWKKLGGKGVPVITVKDQAMVGFSPGRLQAMLGSNKPDKGCGP